MNSIVDYLQRQASQLKDRPFLTENNQTLSFGQIFALVKKMAVFLSLHGVQKDDRVILIIEGRIAHMLTYLSARFRFCCTPSGREPLSSSPRIIPERSWSSLRTTPKLGKTSHARFSLSHSSMTTGRNTGVMDEDGFITVQRRVNDQISVDGMKCQPLEVESILNLHPDVKESAVVGLPDENTYQCVGDAIATNSVQDQSRLVESLQAHCRQRLEPVKIPKKIVFIEAVPELTSARIKRLCVSPMFFPGLKLTRYRLM